ncbi:lipase member H-A-like [Aricia agestis]|uniref:lipase member H-A-like n=1 Tax=Aricia agestis TaxID=91739 RepID=UPI001C201D74|nr:lipase member H-A-like [Aricia agestis]
MLCFKIILVHVTFCLFFNSTCADREDEGYPSGFMSVCPGSTFPAAIPRSQLRYLYFVVQGQGRSRARYSYWTAGEIASDPRIDFTRRTVVVAIGYLDSTNFPISALFANQYEELGYNVILVDNQRFATVLYYLAARLMRPVGKHVAEVLVELTRSGLDPGKLELVGFSLGGQTISYIAKNYRQMTGRNVSRLIALEPAGPCFRTLGPGDRLDASDADFVQVIHTNIDGYGMPTRMGHVDIYVNGGEYQPGDLTILPCTSTCSHFRVLWLWVSALKHPNKFLALRCNSIQDARDSQCYGEPQVVNLMGNKVEVKIHGVFYLATTHTYPFYLGKKGLKQEYVWWRRIDAGNDTVVYT